MQTGYELQPEGHPRQLPLLEPIVVLVEDYHAPLRHEAVLLLILAVLGAAKNKPTSYLSATEP